MRNKKASFTLLSLTLGICMLSSELSAWQRTPMNLQRCQQQGKTPQRCEKENAEDNAYSFEALLSPDSYKKYNDFSPDQKKMALDYADGNKMDPNEAVAKVAAQYGIY